MANEDLFWWSGAMRHLPDDELEQATSGLGKITTYHPTIQRMHDMAVVELGQRSKVALGSLPDPTRSPDQGGALREFQGQLVPAEMIEKRVKTARCEVWSISAAVGHGHGMCDTPLDEHGQCPNVSNHREA